MRIWLIGLVLVLGACNLGSGADAEDERPVILTNTASAPIVPQVEIISPADGAEFLVNEQIIVSAQAVHPQGVTRVQLLADDDIVKTVQSESLAGDTTFSAALDYTPRVTGEITLSVVAFRNATVSEATSITVQVRDELSQITATPVTDPDTPQIPDDGVCRALTNTNLNFRRLPTTLYDTVILTLPGGTLTPIAARLSDNKWWKISYGGYVGWISADFTTVYGNCTTVPVEFVNIPTPTTPPPLYVSLTPSRTWTPLPTWTPTTIWIPPPIDTPIPGRPDLVVTSIFGRDNLTLPVGQQPANVTYTITVTNTGFGPTNQFSTRLTLDDKVFDLGVASGLRNGESLTYRQELTFNTPGVYTLRVMTDVDNQVDELSEANNNAVHTLSVYAP